MTRLTAARWWRSRFRSCAAAVWIACLWAAEGEKPVVQPIPFSHKQHAGAGLKCFDCHGGAKENERAGLPAAQKCMLCHASIKADAPAIRKVAEAAKAGEKIAWVRLYKVPDYVFFNHANHLKGGVECVSCHGPVATRDVLAAEVSTKMQGCVTCHRQRQVSTECSLCHQLGQ